MFAELERSFEKSVDLIAKMDELNKDLKAVQPLSVTLYEENIVIIDFMSRRDLLSAAEKLPR